LHSSLHKTAACYHHCRNHHHHHRSIRYVIRQIIIDNTIPTLTLSQIWTPFVIRIVVAVTFAPPVYRCWIIVRSPAEFVFGFNIIISRRENGGPKYRAEWWWDESGCSATNTERIAAVRGRLCAAGHDWNTSRPVDGSKRVPYV